MIAEGLEALLQIEQIKSLQCEYDQGYLFLKTVERNQAQTLVESGQYTATAVPGI